MDRPQQSALCRHIGGVASNHSRSSQKHRFRKLVRNYGKPEVTITRGNCASSAKNRSPLRDWPSQEEYKVNYVKGIATDIRQKDGRLLVRGEDTTMGRPMEVPMDMVILSVGMEPSAGTQKMAAMFGLKMNKYKFIETIGGALNTVATSVDGVFACGASTGPADLEDSISSASAAAMKAIGTVRKTAMAAG